MRFGHFDDENREYVIEKPNTPLPWINYLGTKKYCALISNTAGGYSFYVDPRERRILRYRYDNIPFDSNGRYLYIRNNKNGDYYSPTWQPVQKKLEKYECRHGMGYTKIASLRKGIKTRITYFVPLDENLEIWKVEIENTGPAALDLSMFSFVEFCLWDAVGDSTNFQRTWSIGQAHCEENTIIHDTMHENWVDILAFFSTSEKIEGYDCQRRNFIGNYGYNSLAKPQAVIDGKCSNSKAIGWAPIGSHQINIKLKPKQKKEIYFVLGIADDKKEAKLKAKKFTQAKVVTEEFEKLKEYWDENLSKIQVETPEPEINSMLNIWNQYQCMQTFNWSRYASYYEAGIGRGMGFRDSNQDTLGFVHMIPKQVRKRILELASIQFEEGDTYHQYSPISGKGALYGYSDDQLWLVISVANYIKKTGDWKILDELVPFAEKQLSIPAQKGHYSIPSLFSMERGMNPPLAEKGVRLYEHLRRAIFFTWKNVGPHKLPKAGFADWNDCINMVGPKNNAESVLVGEMFVYACREMINLSSHKKNKKDREFCEEAMATMLVRVNDNAWDGNWYLRAFDDNSRPLGTSKDKDAKIFLETQAWGVMSGVAHDEKGKKCMDSVNNYLATDNGIKLLHPPFSEYRPELGEISTYPAGLKENAAIFCHPNPWAIISECILKRADRAYNYYKAILPAMHNMSSEIRKTEPYVYCQMIAGPDHPDFGEGKNSWLTGSAAWNFVAAIEWILGILVEYKNMVIDPCIPKKWKEFKVKYEIRGAKYNIIVKNRFGVTHGVKLLKVDDEVLKGNSFPLLKDGKEHKVEVILA